MALFLSKCHIVSFLAGSWYKKSRTSTYLVHFNQFAGTISPDFLKHTLINKKINLSWSWVIGVVLIFFVLFLVVTFFSGEETGTGLWRDRACLFISETFPPKIPPNAKAPWQRKRGTKIRAKRGRESQAHRLMTKSVAAVAVVWPTSSPTWTVNLT